LHFFVRSRRGKNAEEMRMPGKLWVRENEEGLNPFECGWHTHGEEKITFPIMRRISEDHEGLRGLK
jgi:hypothetical protein